jgi:hypothetical protein
MVPVIQNIKTTNKTKTKTNKTGIQVVQRAQRQGRVRCSYVQVTAMSRNRELGRVGAGKQKTPKPRTQTQIPEIGHGHG